MRVVITGASGNVGTALVERLGEDEAVEQIVGVCRREHDWRPSKTTWVYADVASDDLTGTIRGADAVVHLAWLFHPTRHPEETWRANVLGTEGVLRAVARADVPVLVVASSVGAYSPPDGTRAGGRVLAHNGCPTAAYSRRRRLSSGSSTSTNSGSRNGAVRTRASVHVPGLQRRSSGASSSGLWCPSSCSGRACSWWCHCLAACTFSSCTAWTSPMRMPLP